MARYLNSDKWKRSTNWRDNGTSYVGESWWDTGAREYNEGLPCLIPESCPKRYIKDWYDGYMTAKSKKSENTSINALHAAGVL